MSHSKAAPGGGRWSILELLRGAGLESTSRKYRVAIATVSEWRDRFLEGGEASLNYSADCLGVHMVKKGHRFEALEPIRQAVHQQLGFSQPAATSRNGSSARSTNPGCS